MKRIILITVSLILLCFSMSHARMVSVAVDHLNMRSGPGKDKKILWELGKGYPLKTIRSKGNWLKVIDYENDTGWVHKNLVHRKAHLVVKKKIINIRKGPGTKYKIVRQAKKGVVFRTVKRKKGWVKVLHDESKVTGWVKRSLLWGW